MCRQIYRGFAIALVALTLITTRAPSSAAQVFVFRVTDVSLRLNYLTPTQCPLNVSLNAYITANGPGVVRYAFTHSEGPGVLRDAGTRELVFRAAGTQRVSATWTFNDLGGASHYEGWAAIRILSPNPLESSHATGAFSLNCGSQQSQAILRREQTVVTPQPRATGHFRITLNGFSCQYPTADDPLQRDGVDDEVFLEVAVLLFDGHTVIDQPGAHSLVIGDTNNQPGRIRGGSGHNLFGGNGGFKRGDSFPTDNPWLRSSPITTDRPPLLVWEGDLTSGANGIVVVPSIWESDNRAGDLTSQWMYAIHDVQGMAGELNSLFTDPGGEADQRWRARWTDAQNRIEEKFKARMVTEDINRNDQDRPIGMRRTSDNKFAFKPRAFVITYEVARELASADSYVGLHLVAGHGMKQIGYIEDDPPHPQAVYVLYMQIEQLR